MATSGVARSSAPRNAYVKEHMMEVYAGLYKVSCDMCGGLVKPQYTIVHDKDVSKVDICSVCYGKCLSHPKFNEGIEQGHIRVTGYLGA